MRLLLDQMLPARLCERLADGFDEIRHVRPLGLSEASDVEIWRYARRERLTIVTKDADFQTLLALEGPPPRVVWLRLGNATTSEVETCLRRHVETIRAFHEADAGCLLIRN